MFNIIFISSKLCFKICIYINNRFVINANNYYFIAEMFLNICEYVKNYLLNARFYIYNFNNAIRYIFVIKIYNML